VGTEAAAESSLAEAPEAEAQVPCALMPAHHHWLHAGYSSSAEFAAASHLLHSNRHNINVTNIELLSLYDVCNHNSCHL
jgi:hypothetical protein